MRPSRGLSLHALARTPRLPACVAAGASSLGACTTSPCTHSSTMNGTSFTCFFNMSVSPATTQAFVAHTLPATMDDDDAESIALAAKLRADAEARATARLAAREAKLRALKESSAEQSAVAAPPLPPPPSIPEPPQHSVSSTSAVQAPLNALEPSKTQARVVRCTSFKRRGVRKPTRKDNVPSSAIETSSPQRGLYAQRLQRARSQRSASGTRGAMPIADGDGDHDHEMGITIHPQ